MKKIRTFAQLCFVLALSTATVSAAAVQSNSNNQANQASQNLPADSLPKYRIGGFAGLLLNNHGAEFSTLPGFPACCPGYTGGTGTGFQLGALIEFPITPLYSFEARLGLASLGATMTVQENIGNYVGVSPNGDTTIGSITTEHSLASSLLAVGAEFLANIRPIPGLVLTGGLRTAFSLQGTFDQEERLISPNGMRFIDGTTVRNATSGSEIPDKSALLLHAVLGAGYELPVAKNITLAPEVRYYLPFNNISSVDWNVSSLSAGVALRWSVFPPPPKQEIRDTIYRRDTTEKRIAGLGMPSQPELVERNVATSITEDDATIRYTTEITERYSRNIPVAPDLSATVRTFAQTKEGEKIQSPQIVVEEIESKESYPLLPYIFFPAGNSDLANTRMKTLTADRTPSFDEGALPKNSLEMYYHLLNITGKRLRDKPTSVITLTGCANTPIEPEEAVAGLALSRAEAVKRYLVEVWNISPNRITVKERTLPSMPSNNAYSEGREENRRVEIASDEPLILEPISARDVVRTINPGTVTIEPSVVAQAGVASWKMVVSSGNKTLETFSGSGLPDSKLWTLDPNILGASTDTVQIRLDIVDSLGQKAMASTAMAVQQITIRKKREELQNSKTIDKYSLILFDFDKATLNSGHRRSLEIIKNYINNNSVVAISGFADKTGDAAYNKELSRRRAEEVRRSLNLPGASITGVGNEQMLFANDTPEGRFYCRTVVVTVENEAKK